VANALEASITSLDCSTPQDIMIAQLLCLNSTTLHWPYPPQLPLENQKLNTLQLNTTAAATPPPTTINPSNVSYSKQSQSTPTINEISLYGWDPRCHRPVCVIKSKNNRVVVTVADSLWEKIQSISLAITTANTLSRIHYGNVVVDR